MLHLDLMFAVAVAVVVVVDDDYSTVAVVVHINVVGVDFENHRNVPEADDVVDMDADADYDTVAELVAGVFDPAAMSTDALVWPWRTSRRAPQQRHRFGGAVRCL